MKGPGNPFSLLEVVHKSIITVTGDNELVFVAEDERGESTERRFNAEYVDIGRKEKMRKGLRLVVFRENAELVHPETGRILGCDTEEVGEVIIREVDEGRSVGEFTRARFGQIVSQNDRVITK